MWYLKLRNLRSFKHSLTHFVRRLEQVKATHIFAEVEVEYEWVRLMETVKENLAELSVEEGSPNFLTWSTPFYDMKVICLNFVCL